MMDMRNGMDTLAEQVRKRLRMDPTSSGMAVAENSFKDFLVAYLPTDKMCISCL
jgi:hypothetical protein